MKKKNYYVLFLLLALSSLLLLWRFQSYRVHNQNLTNQLNYKYELLSEEHKKIKQYFVFQNHILSKKQIISFADKKSNIFKKSGGNYLVACFSGQNCGVCMKRLIVDLDDFKKKTNFRQIFLLGDIPEDEFYSMLGLNKLDYDYSFMPELFMRDNDYFTYPLLFIINSRGGVQHLFVPDLLKDYNEIYFDKVLPSLIIE